MRRLFVVLVFVATAMSTAFGVRAQEATPVNAPDREIPTAAGVQDSVRRGFENSANTITGTGWMNTRLAEFDTEEHAELGAQLWIETALRLPESVGASDFTALERVSVPVIGDSTYGLAGEASYQQDRFEGALLAVRVGRLVYTFEAGAQIVSPLNDEIAVAQRVLGKKPLASAATVGITYCMGGLWDLLPRVEHMPVGFSFSFESKIGAGVFKSVDKTPAQISGTPTAHDCGS